MRSAAFPLADDIVTIGDQVGGAPEVEVGEGGPEVGHERFDLLATTARFVQRIPQKHVGSGKLIALDTSTGKVLKEIDLGPVFAGPSLSRGRIYVGGGNTLWTPADFECFFPKQYTGSVRSFGLPGEDEVDRLGRGKK